MILDASTRGILANHISSKITLYIATKTILKLMKQRKLKLTEGAFVHSYQGAHYTNTIFQNLLKENLGQSMSRHGNY